MRLFSMTPFAWRPMRENDMDAVMALSEIVHPSLPEQMETQLQRLSTFPEGCLVLAHDRDIQGYAFSHPIYPDTPPCLDSVPPVPGPDTTHYYLHDFVVAPTLRGGGFARAGVETLLEVGRHYDLISLISVYGTARFWSRFGFRVRRDVGAQDLETYGPGAVLMSLSYT